MDLKMLFTLQELEAEEQRTQSKIKTDPILTEMRSIKTSFEKQKSTYLGLEEAVRRLRADLERFPARVLQAEQELEAERKAVYDGSVTNPRALAAREAQIAAREERVQELTDLQQAYQQDLSYKEEQAAALKQEMEQMYRAFRSCKARAQEGEAALRQRLEALDQERTELLRKVAAEDLTWFRKQQKGGSGRVIAPLDGEMVCGGCHTHVPPALYRRVKGQALCTCESCGRILFIDE